MRIDMHVFIGIKLCIFMEVIMELTSRLASPKIKTKAKPSRKSRSKRPINLTIRGDLLATAKELGIKISQAAEQGIAMAVKEIRAEQWVQENKAALESSNTFVEEHGLPLDKHRQF